MRRRSFIQGFAAFAALPLAARAQQSAPIIGFLNSASRAAFAHFVVAFRRGLNEIGYVEGQNVAIEYRWAEGQLEWLPGLAFDLVRLAIFNAGSEAEIDHVFMTLPEQHVGALLVLGSAFFTSKRDKIVALAAQYRIPTMYQWREYATAGGLISYGESLEDAYRQVGVYADRILKGEKPADLPVLQPTKFEFVINLKTAKALGLAVPDKLPAIADEVIK